MHSDATRHYHTIYQQQESPPLYAAPWWLDQVCGPGKWDVLVTKNNHSLPSSCLPFYKTRIKGLSAITTPPLTQWVSIISDKENDQSQSEAWFDDLPNCRILDLSI